MNELEVTCPECDAVCTITAPAEDGWDPELVKQGPDHVIVGWRVWVRCPTCGVSIPHPREEFTP